MVEWLHRIRQEQLLAEERERKRILEEQEKEKERERYYLWVVELPMCDVDLSSCQLLEWMVEWFDRIRQEQLLAEERERQRILEEQEKEKER
jgi:hypothetical protein